MALLFVTIALIFTNHSYAQTDTTWHSNGIDSIKTDNQVQINNSLRVADYIDVDSIRVRTIHIGDSSIIAGSYGTTDIISSTNGMLAFGTSLVPDGLFSWLNTGIGTVFPKHKLHINDSQVVFPRHAVNLAFTSYGSNSGTGTTEKDGFQIGLLSSMHAEINQQENLDMTFYTGNNNPSGTILNAPRMCIKGTTGASQGNIGIGTTSPDASALLHINATNKGVLIPSVQLTSTSDATTIASPATSLLVYNVIGGGLTPAGYWYNAGSPSVPNWVQLISTATSGAWLLTGNSIASGDFIGTTNNQDFVVKTNNTEKMRVLSGGNVGIGTTSPTSVLHTIASGAKTTTYTGNLLTNIATSSTSSINKTGLEIKSTGTWSGASSNNIGLYVSSVTGGTTNYDAIFNGGGNVGIGTNAAVHNKLVVVSSAGKIKMAIGHSYSISATAPTSIDSSTYLHLGMGETNEGSYRLIGFGYNNAGAALPAAWMGYQQMTSNGNQFGDLIFGTRNVTTNTTATERMRIQYDGNVGVGTAAPSSILHTVASGVKTTSYSGNLFTNTATNATVNATKSGVRITSTGTWTGAGNGTNIGLYVSSVTGGTNNYDAIFNGGGNVGIGTTSPSEKLEVNGNIKIPAGNSYIGSDIRLKTDIDSIENSLQLVKQLQGVYFKWDTTVLNPMGLNYSSGRQIGFIAQNVQTVLPEIVATDSDSLGLLSVDYSRFTPVLVEAVKELAKQDSLQGLKTEADSVLIDSLKQGLSSANERIDNQDSIISSLQNQITMLASLINDCCHNNGNGNGNGNGHNNSSTSENGNYKSMSITTSTNVELNNKNIIVLDQNAPNPFAEQTAIGYYLPDNISKAQIVFYDRSGKALKTVDLKEKGKGVLNVFANDLTSGLYTYSLIVDGQIVETKKMIKE